MQERSQSTNRRHEAFETSFPASVESLVAPRQTFEQWLAEDDVPREVVSELTVVFSELTSNAAAVSDDDDGRIHTRAWREGDDLVLTVENPPPDQELVVQHWDLDDALRGGGRGLLIVRAYTDSLEANSSEDGALLIRCRRCIAG